MLCVTGSAASKHWDASHCLVKRSLRVDQSLRAAVSCRIVSRVEELRAKAHL